MTRLNIIKNKGKTEHKSIPEHKKMAEHKKILIFFLIILNILLVIPLAAAGVLYERYFGHRTETNTSALAPDMKEYPNLKRKKVQFPSNHGQLLTGYLYIGRNYTNPSKGLIVLSHGINCGHIDYLEEINYLCSWGYTVLGYDNTGCNESEGSSMIGLVQSSIDLDYALRYVENQDELKTMPVLLYGHSWGGYAVCSVLNGNHNVKAVVSRSGFNHSRDVLIDGGVYMYGDWVRIITPYLYFYEKIKFGRNADNTAEKGIKNAKAEILILYGAKDNIISRENSIYHIVKDYKQKNVTVILYQEKEHDVVLSDEALCYLKNKKAEEAALINKYNGKSNIPKEVMDAYINSVDRMKIRQLDENVMKNIIDFYDAVIKK